MGTREGNLYVFVNRVLSQVIEAHKKAITCICTLNEGVVTGGRDGLVKLWNPQLQCINTFNLATLYTGNHYQGLRGLSVRSVWWDSNDANTILVGLRGGEIIEIDINTSTDYNGGPLTEGHFSGNTIGLTVNPNNDQFATIASDCVIRVWEADSYFHRCVKAGTICDGLEKPTCIEFSPDGGLLAVGLKGENMFAVVLTSNFKTVRTVKFPDRRSERQVRRGWNVDSTSLSHAVRWCPTRPCLAVSYSQENKNGTWYSISLHDVEKDYEMVTTVFHEYPVHSFDFSIDGRYLQSHSKVLYTSFPLIKSFISY